MFFLPFGLLFSFVSGVAAHPSWPLKFADAPLDREVGIESLWRRGVEWVRTGKSQGSSLRVPTYTAEAQFSCDVLVEGLSLEDCEHMAAMGMYSQGENAVFPNEDPDGIWIGDDGPNTFIFVNEAEVPLTVVMWYANPLDGQSSFMNARVPKITYSLPSFGDAVCISLANGVPGGWSSIYNRETKLTEYGQIDNTFGEFSTGSFATVDVSRLVNMSGRPMTVMVQGGCVANLTRCVYACESEAQSCGDAGTYSLMGCWGPNAVESIDRYGNPTGGCEGWANGGRVEIVLT